MAKKDAETAIAAAAGIAASRVIENERKQDEVEALAETIPESERASKLYKIRVLRLKKPGQQGGNVWANAGSLPFVQGDQDWYDKNKQELACKYGPGDYDGVPCDANGKAIDKASHWVFKITYDEAISWGWIDYPGNSATGGAGLAGIDPNAPPRPIIKDKVTEAKEKVAVAKEELEFASLKQQLEELQGSKKAAVADPTMAGKLEMLQKQVADAERKVELARQEATHKEEMARLNREKTDLENRINQQARDLDTIKTQLANPTKPQVDVGAEIGKALDHTLGKALDKAQGFAALLAPVVAALATKLMEKAPAPPPPPDYIAMITALKNTIQPPTTVDPIAMINQLAGTMVSLKKVVVDEEEGPDEEEILDRELRKMQRMRDVMGGNKSTVAEVGDIANGTLKIVGDTIARVAGARAGGNREETEEDRAKALRKRRQLARVRQQEEEGAGGVVQDPPARRTRVDMDEAPESGKRPVKSNPKPSTQTGQEPTPKEWAALSQGILQAMRKDVDPAKVARGLVKKFPQVASELVQAPSIGLVELGLAKVAGEMGRPYGIAVNELASELRKDAGAAWGAKLLDELKKLAAAITENKADGLEPAAK